MRVRPSILFIPCILIFFGIAWGGLGLQYETPVIEGFHPLDDEAYAVSQLSASHPIVLKLNGKLFKDTSDIDFEKRQITFSRVDSLGYIMWQYHYGELSDYLLARRNFVLFKGWHDEVMKAGRDEVKDKDKSMKLQWELPVQYPSWAQRILGNEPPKLSINGKLGISIGYDNSKKTDNASDKDAQNNGGGFEFNQTYQFSITGSVGRLININISASSEEEFSMSNNLKNFKIEYKESTPGELEDEIIQEVIAGYTDFDMPGTSLSGYSESHKGLFGIKIKSKFGPLSLTTIASTEQGESQKFSKSSSSSETNGNATHEEQYEMNKYFFLDKQYRTYYNHIHALKNSDKNSIAPPKVTEISVWRKVDKPKENEDIQKQIRVGDQHLDSLSQTFRFEELKINRYFWLNEKEGYIRFADSANIRTDDLIAIYFKTDGSLQRGEKYNDSSYMLWTLKPQSEIESEKDDPERFCLMWRNVYSMSITSLNELNMKIKRVNQDNNEEYEQDSKSTYYTNILGISDDKGKLNNRADIFDVTNQVLIFPPWDTSFYCNEPFRNPDLGDYRDSLIYMYSSSSKNRLESYKAMYNLYMGSKSKSTSFNLDFGVMEGTEKVIADGTVLERDRDYTIDYNMGTLDLTSPRAKAAQKVDIEYQRDAVFVPDRKGFLGIHGEMALPFLSENSFIGGSILYQGTKTTDDVPRLGQEPYWKLLFDLNTKIDLQPEWMTTLVNKIPLVHTDAQSSASLNVEVAHSIMNPNRDNESYVDDFEEAKESYSLGEDYKSWHRASPPYSSDSLSRYPPAWDFYWFTPIDHDANNRLKNSQIYVKTDEERKREEDSYESVLRFNCVPAPTEATYKDRYKNAWAGIMFPISKSFADRTRDQYFEFIVNSTEANGTLNFQMGDMREDISNNGGPPDMIPEKEDTSIIYNSKIDQNLDHGLDMLRDTNEVCLVPNGSNGWDTLKHDNLILGEFSKDPSKDNARDYNQDNSNNGKWACRTENNHLPDDEDVNFDGTVQYANPEKYFNFKIDLKDTLSPFIDKTAKLKDGWKKYRIPLKSADSLMNIITKVGDPSWMQIYMIRIIWNGFDSSKLTSEQKLILTKMEFVGNQWQSSSDSSNNKIEASVINTEDDDGYLEMLDPKLKRKDNTMKGVYEKQQALKLKFKFLKRSEEAMVRRNLSYQSLDLSAYENLNLMVYGRDTTGSSPSPLYGGHIKFVFRFGSDSSTYYEYNRTINQGWNNNIKIDLRQLAKYKDSMMVMKPDSAISDSSGEFIIKAPKNRQPNFAKITWMALGVKRDNVASDLDSTFGEIYVDEMTVSGINKLDGYAATASISTKFADFLDMSATMNYGNGDFRKMTDNQIVSTNSNLSGTLRADVNLNKFLPSQWGVSLPVGATINTSVSRPQLKTGSDVSLNEGKSDGFLDMIGDAADMVLNTHKSKDITRSERYETKTIGKSIYTSYSKSAVSDNIISNLTADRIKTDLKYNSSVTETHLGPKAGDRSTDYVKIDSTDNYSGKLEYDLSPKNTPSWTKWSPFSNTKNTWIPPRLKNYELSLLPSKIDFDLADVSYGWSKQIDTKNMKDPISNRTFNLNHGFSFEYFPINPLISLNYNVNINRDLDTIAGDTLSQMIKKVFSEDQDTAWGRYHLLWGEKKRTQHAGLKLNPELFDWLTTSAEYGSDYTGDVVKWSSDPDDYLNLGVTTVLSFNGSLDLGKIFGDLAAATAKSGSASFFGMIDKGFNKIGLNSVQFTYTANSNLLNNNVSPGLLGSQHIHAGDFFKYQLGVGNRGRMLNYLLGDMDDNAFGGMLSRQGSESSDYYQNDQRSVSRDYRLSSGLNLTTPFEIHFDPISIGWTKQIKKQAKDTTYYDSSITSPDFSITASTPALQKISIFEKAVTGLNLRSSFTYKNAKHWSSTGSDSSERYDFSPLFSLTGTVKKWPINFNYAHNHSIDKQHGINELKNTNDDDNLDVSYSIESNSRLSQIKILKWSIPVRGKTTTGLNFSRSHKVEQSSNTNETTTSFAPYLSYIFTDNVTGKIDYKYSKTKDRVGGTQTNNVFLLSVDILF